MDDPNALAAMMQQQYMQQQQWAGNFMMGPGAVYDPATGQPLGMPMQQPGAYGGYGYPQMDPNAAALAGGYPYMSAPIYQTIPIQAQPVAGYGGGYQQRPPYQKGPYGGGPRHFQNNGGHQSQSKNNMQKYKTSLCRHYEQHGSCSQGDQCLFAHGQEEIRSISDPLPPHAIERQQQQQQQSNTFGGPSTGGYQSTYQRGGGYGGGRGNFGGAGRGGSGYNPRPHYTRQVGGSGGYQQNNGSGGSNFKTAICKNFVNGNCKYGNSCSFAHGEHELKKGGQPHNSPPSGPPTMPPPVGGYGQISAMPQQTIQPIIAAGLQAGQFPALGGGSQPNTQ